MFKSTGREEKIWFSTLQQPIRIIFKINKKETHNLIFESTPTKSKLPQNPTTLIHSSILTNTLCATIQETNFENKSPSNSMPHTQTSSTKKKKKITQHKNMEGLNKKQNPIWQSREERERERTCVSAGCTVGFGPNGFSSILPHPVKYIWFATGPNYKPPWLFRINRPISQAHFNF